jgi:hypothetical protein
VLPYSGVVDPFRKSLGGKKKIRILREARA